MNDDEDVKAEVNEDKEIKEQEAKYLELSWAQYCEDQSS